MKKLLSITLAALLACISLLSTAQSNRKGTVHVGIQAGAEAGNTNVYRNSTQNYSANIVGLQCISQNLSLHIAYGLSKRLSAGIFLKGEKKDIQRYDYKGGVFGIEGKFYAINKEKFNFYISPSVGYATGKINNTYYKDEINKIESLNYALFAGFNWYLIQHFGITADLGYGHGSSHTNFYDRSSYTNITSLVYYGAVFNIGIAAKFGGK